MHAAIQTHPEALQHNITSTHKADDVFEILAFPIWP